MGFELVGDDEILFQKPKPRSALDVAKEEYDRRDAIARKRREDAEERLRLWHGRNHDEKKETGI